MSDSKWKCGWTLFTDGHQRCLRYDCHKGAPCDGLERNFQGKAEAPLDRAAVIAIKYLGRLTTERDRLDLERDIRLAIEDARRRMVTIDEKPQTIGDELFGKGF